MPELPSRRGPGRPRKVHSGVECGPILGTAGAGTRVNREHSGSATAQGAIALAPRLLDLHGAAQYLSVSEWTIRELKAAGVLPRVRMPLPNGGELRKLLFDVQD